MKIAITGGKGGTGKSTVATALAYELSGRFKKSKILLMDLDVDCPNDDLILGIKTEKVKDIKNMVPEFDFDKCIKCGKCAEVCREHAIVFVKEKYPILVPEQCIGCKACKIVCPVNAIYERKQKIGEIFTGRKRNITLISGKMKIGVEESSLVVNAIKRYIKSKEKDYDFIIIDTAAGTHCPVIVALLGCEKGFAVTEPTPLGSHDLDLILKLMKILKIESHVVLNRSDIGNKKIIEKTAKKYNAKIFVEIPYSKKIEKDYSAGKPITHSAIQKIVKVLEVVNS